MNKILLFGVRHTRLFPDENGYFSEAGNRTRAVKSSSTVLIPALSGLLRHRLFPELHHMERWHVEQAVLAAHEVEMRVVGDLE